MRGSRALGRTMLALAAAALLAGAAGADDKKTDRPRDVASGKGEVLGLRVEKLPDGKMQVTLGDGAVRVIVAGDAPPDAVRKALAALEKMKDKHVAAREKGPRDAAPAKDSAKHSAKDPAKDPVKDQAKGPKGPAPADQAPDKKHAKKDAAGHVPLPREKMAALVKQQQELLEQAKQIVIKVHNIKDDQDAGVRELAVQFQRVQAQLHDLAQAAAPVHAAPKVLVLKDQTPTGPKAREEKRIIVHVVPKPGSEGAPTVARLALPAPSAEIKELKEQVSALKMQLDDLRTMVKTLVERDKARPR